MGLEAALLTLVPHWLAKYAYGPVMTHQARQWGLLKEE